jgi:predicted flap endonuclease-1-like 5' DNA nuclease
MTPSGNLDGAASETLRRTLAMRIAERNRLRELRAERLARLQGAAVPAAEAGPVRLPASDAAQDALEHFLRALAGGLAGLPPEPAAPPAAVLHFQRPEPSPPAGDLDRLPGAGPGLIWVLERAGLRSLADLAPLAAEDLAARLGPLGRLVPAETWIAAARAAADPAPAP